MAVVLCTGADPALLVTRKLILERAGHTVVTADTLPAVISACKQRLFNVAVIGQSASPRSKNSIASIIREHCPSTKILELHASNQAKSIQFADSWLEVPADVPQELAQQVTMLAKENSKKID